MYDGGFNCDCIGTGFHGSYCTTDVDDCNSNPCKNDGYCKNLPGNRYECICKTGFEGERCHLNMACLSLPCANNGRCTLDAVGYQCSCVDGWSGENCTSKFWDAKTVFWIVLTICFVGAIGGASWVGKKNVNKAQMHKEKQKSKLRKCKKNTMKKRYHGDYNTPDYVKKGKKGKMGKM